MRKLVINIFILLPFVIFGQHLVPELPINTGEITKVIVRPIRVTVIDTLPMKYKRNADQSKRTEHIFENNNILSRTLYFNRNNIHREIQFEYDTVGRRVIIKETINGHGTKVTGNYTLREYIYSSDSRDKLVKYNIWYYSNEKDTLELSSFFKDIKFDAQNNLKSFKHYGIKHNGDTTKRGIYELSYNSHNQLIYYDEMAYDSMTIMVQSSTDSLYWPQEVAIEEPVILTRRKYHYNEEGLMYREDIELTSKEYNPYDNGYSDYYEFDEKNNWIKLYRKWDDQPEYVLNFEREIIYK